MEHLAEWQRAGRQLTVKTNTSDKPNSWQGRPGRVNAFETT